MKGPENVLQFIDKKVEIMLPAEVPKLAQTMKNPVPSISILLYLNEEFY